MTNVAVMVTKNCSGSEQGQPDSYSYLATERTRQSVFSPHPKGKALPMLSIVEALDGRIHSTLRTPPNQACGGCHVTAPVDHGVRP